MKKKRKTINKMWESLINENWKHMCYVKVGTDDYEYETDDKEVIKDFAKIHPHLHILKWLQKHKHDDILLTILIYPNIEMVEYAIGVWNKDVDEHIDNRKYRESDYKEVIKWLEKEYNRNTYHK